MLFPATNILIGAIEPYAAPAKIDSGPKTKGRSGRTYLSDLVHIDTDGRVGFEVTENRIVISFFGGRRRFTGQNTPTSSAQEGYIGQAKAFLTALFTGQIRRVDHYRGNVHSSEELFLSYPDGRAEERIGSIQSAFSRFAPLFGKRSVRSGLWTFDRAKVIFLFRPSGEPDPDAIEVIGIDDNCYIEIFFRHRVYTYTIMEMQLDDDMGMYYYYWSTAENVPPAGWYDTKERAVAAAKAALSLRTDRR